MERMACFYFLIQLFMKIIQSFLFYLYWTMWSVRVILMLKSGVICPFAAEGRKYDAGYNCVPSG